MLSLWRGWFGTGFSRAHAPYTYGPGAGPLAFGRCEGDGGGDGAPRRARRLVARGLLPAEVVHAHPGFLRPCAGVDVPRRLVVLAVDLARTPGGTWQVRGDRASVPRGLGAVLSARRVLARLHPDLYRALRVQRVEGFYDSLRSTLADLAQGAAGGDSVRTVILSPGPDADVFPEHAYL